MLTSQQTPIFALSVRQHYLYRSTESILQTPSSASSVSIPEQLSLNIDIFNPIEGGGGGGSN